MAVGAWPGVTGDGPGRAGAGAGARAKARVALRASRAKRFKQAVRGDVTGRGPRGVRITRAALSVEGTSHLDTRKLCEAEMGIAVLLDCSLTRAASRGGAWLGPSGQQVECEAFVRRREEMRAGSRKKKNFEGIWPAKRPGFFPSHPLVLVSPLARALGAVRTVEASLQVILPAAGGASAAFESRLQRT